MLNSLDGIRWKALEKRFTDFAFNIFTYDVFRMSKEYCQIFNTESRQFKFCQI